MNNTDTAESKTTTDHDTIKRWAEQRNGEPAIVKGTEEDGTGAGLLRIKFDSNEDLEPISWEEFFKTFDRKHLKFLYQPKMASTFHKFIRE